jgi:hypothetical protein
MRDVMAKHLGQSHGEETSWRWPELKINGGADRSSRPRSRAARRLVAVPSLWAAGEERDGAQVLRWRRTGGARAAMEERLDGGGLGQAMAREEEEGKKETADER